LAVARFPFLPRPIQAGDLQEPKEYEDDKGRVRIEGGAGRQ
jgi:hypothetical protein